MDDESKIIRSKEVQALTGLSRKTVRRLTEDGIIPHAYRLKSGIYRYHRGALEVWWLNRQHDGNGIARIREIVQA